MTKLLKAFFTEEEGNIIEYIIVLAVIAVVVAALFPGLREKLVEWFKGMIDDVDAGVGDSTRDAAQCADNGGVWQDDGTGDGYCQW